jgi:hypothetical protein
VNVPVGPSGSIWAIATPLQQRQERVRDADDAEHVRRVHRRDIVGRRSPPIRWRHR